MKFCDNSNFSLNLCPKEEKFIQFYLVNSKISIICNLKEEFAYRTDRNNTNISIKYVYVDILKQLSKHCFAY
jgi:hypothetical protein